MDSSTTIAWAQKSLLTERRSTGQAVEGNIPFFRFIAQVRSNRLLLFIALSGIVVQFIIFKLLYPFPDFFSDSYSYIYAASAHLDVSIWPIGYSKFLAVFHALTHSDTALVAFQYFFLELATLYFFFTLLYFYHPGRTTKVILFIFLFFNPLFLYLSNYVNSDPLFVALSLWWFTELIWILNRPRLYQVFTQSILLFLAFTVRNNAYIYPFIALAAFLLTRQRPWFKLIGILAGPLLILPFILHTRQAAKDITGTPQFSLFTGWQLANNTLYMYRYIRVHTKDLHTAGSRSLDTLTKAFYTKVRPGFHEYLNNYVGNFFIRESKAPLKQYVDSHYRFDNNEMETIAAWGMASATFADYGTQLIKEHPLAYIRGFMLLNTKNYFLPPLEKLRVYNLGMEHVLPIAQSWFGYRTTKISAVSRTAQALLLFSFPVIFLLLNINLLGAGLLYYVRRRYAAIPPSYTPFILLTCCLIIANFCFSTLATIIVFRYQVFPMIVCLSLDLLLMERLAAPRPVTTKNNLPIPAITQ